MVGRNAHKLQDHQAEDRQTVSAGEDDRGRHNGPSALPSALFVVDPRKEKNAIAEAHKLGIPVIAIVDTNCDPEEADYPIPGNDDAIRAVKLIVTTIGNAILEGKQGEQLEDNSEKKEDDVNLDMLDE